MTNEWVVVPHNPIQKLTENLWRVEGALPTITLRRVMTVIRLGDRRLVVHSPISMDEPAMQELDAWGKVAFIIVPGRFHRLDAPAWKRRYPEARVLAPRGSRKWIEAKVTVDGTVDELSADPAVTVVPLRGIKDLEVALLVASEDGSTVVLNDAMFNMDRPKDVVGWLVTTLLGSAPGPRISRLFRLINIDDRTAFRADLERLAATPNLQRLIVAHCKLTSGPGAAAAIRQAAAYIR